jgi:GNAT superfamily N-acetyltransferase
MQVLETDWIDQLYVDPDLTGVGIGAELIAVTKRARPDGLRLWTFVSARTHSASTSQPPRGILGTTATRIADLGAGGGASGGRRI